MLHHIISMHCARFVNLGGLVFLLTLSPVGAEPATAMSAAAPKRIQATYEVTKNDQPFAKVQEQFTVHKGSYKVESVTKGIGVYALFGERVLSSSGEVSAQGLKPVRFEMRQGDNPKKTLTADFDWDKQQLRMRVKGKTKEAALTPGVQDLASFAYQFMYLPAPLKGDIAVTLTTGKKLNQYHYTIADEPETLSIAGVNYQTVHLAPAAQDAQETQETKELWLAADYHYVPVRILMVDENGQKLEQVLTELHTE